MQKQVDGSKKLAPWFGLILLLLLVIGLLLQGNSLFMLLTSLILLNVGLILIISYFVIRHTNNNWQLSEQRLLESEERYRRIFENTSDSLLVCDLESGRILEANPACGKLFGCSQQVLINQDVTGFIHPDYLGAFKKFIRVAGTGKQLQGQFLCYPRGKATPFYSRIFTTPLSYQDKRQLLLVIQDETEQFEAYQVLEKRVSARTQELSTLLEISQQIVSTLDLEVLENVLINQLKRVVNYSGVMLFTYQANEVKLLFKHLPISEEQTGQLVYFLERSAVTHHVLQKKEPVIIPDIRGTTSMAQTMQAELGGLLTTIYSYARSQMLVPLVIKDRAVGVINLVYDKPDYYTKQHANLALTVGNQVAVALENTQLYRQAQELAALQERQRLARELHDSTAQVLCSIMLVAEAARMMVQENKGESNQMAQVVNHIVALSEGGLEEMRTMIYELRPETLSQVGLVQALTGQVTALRSRHGIDVQADLAEIEALQISEELKEALYLIAREALHNVVKHAHASLVKLSLRCQNASPDNVTLEVCDNGRGFKADGIFPGHLGLQSIRERVAQFEGALEIESSPGTGTNLRVHFPLKPFDH